VRAGDGAGERAGAAQAKDRAMSDELSDAQRRAAAAAAEGSEALRRARARADEREAALRAELFSAQSAREALEGELEARPAPPRLAPRPAHKGPRARPKGRPGRSALRDLLSLPAPSSRWGRAVPSPAERRFCKVNEGPRGADAWCGTRALGAICARGR
jgi:hypothetical protein